MENLGLGVEPSKGGVTNKRGIYSKIAAREDEIIEKLFSQLQSKNENVSLGAAKTLLNKIVPDIKAVEVSGPDGGPLQLKYIIDLAGGYIPPVGAFNAPSGGSNAGPASLQSTGMASESTQDNDSINGAS